jgi:hypothetical protein
LVQILELTYFIKPQNPKPYQTLAHNKKKLYIHKKDWWGTWGAITLVGSNYGTNPFHKAPNFKP